MNRLRILEILEAYRPGEGLESDLEIRQALDEAARDPELSQIQKEFHEFDEAFGDALNQVQAPADLQEKILQASRLRELSNSIENNTEDRNIIRWLHPASFGIAAAVVIMLALTFTFWSKPGLEGPELALAQDPITSAAYGLYTSLNPAFNSKDGSEVKEYLTSNHGFTPSSLPGDVVWDRAFACDVVQVDGRQVSIICFMAPDNSRSMHLFTFLRREFPNTEVPSRPVIRQTGKSCCAQWGDAEQVYVLYSDKGEENLRRILDI